MTAAKEAAALLIGIIFVVSWVGAIASVVAFIWRPDHEYWINMFLTFFVLYGSAYLSARMLVRVK